MDRARRVLLSLPLLAFFACREPGAGNPSGSRAELAGERSVKIVFSLPGDDIGSPESAALLQRIKDALAAGGAAQVRGSGFGMGSMELALELRSADALPEVERTIRATYPGARYRIERGGP